MRIVVGGTTRGVAAILLGALIALTGAQQVSAATVVELSEDGVAYASALGGPLFPDVARLVPLESESEVFWVRNGALDAAFLQLTLDNTTWNDAAFARALTVSAWVPGTTGSPLAIASPGPCRVLLDGIRLGPGETIAVTATVALSDLHGTSGQNAQAGMDLGVTLTQAADLARDEACSTPSVFVALLPARPAVPAQAPHSEAGTSTRGLVNVERFNTRPFLEGPLLPEGWNQFGSALQWTWVSLLLGAAVFFLLRRRRRFDGNEVLGEGEGLQP